MMNQSPGRRGLLRMSVAAVAAVSFPFKSIMAQTITPLADLNRMDRTSFVAALSGTFERAPWVVEDVYAQRPFATVTALHEAMFAILRAAPRDKLLAFFGKDVDVLRIGKDSHAPGIAAESKHEQGSVGLDSLSDADARRFQEMGIAYKEKFGYPFIIAVLRHTRESIMKELERRLPNDAATEFANSLQEVFYISRWRLVDRVSGPGTPRIHGALSTHVLDATNGQAAADVAIELFEFTGDQARKVGESMTTADGRNGAPLLANRPLPIGRYELRFAVGDYFRKKGNVTAEPPFLDIVPLRFSIAEPEGNYHVPLICTPWSYSTYRGT
jgi:2-oxo-4-hydroxy-4-carboxy-5-ureidoimidazoline decarboxylase